ncbi:MAG TPA: VCBS repeat-containing protein [Opitutaceae bacterium]|nr:VCBS repeat-containing protein [Opitutaceae bacterium]
MKPLAWLLATCLVVMIGTVLFVHREASTVGNGLKKSEGTKDNAPRVVFTPRSIGDPIRGHPMIPHLLITDLDHDGLPDLIACDGETNSVRWLRQSSRGVFTESQIGERIAGPVHASIGDVNGDGRPDLVIASMGIITPNNDKIGSVVVLENLGGGKFKNRTLLENVARVTDVRAVDLNGDGRLDLVVGQFGYVEGEVRWMENLGDWHFRSQVLLNEPGTINTPVADFDGDGSADFAALVSQDSEAVHLFSGNGRGEFRDLLIWKSDNQNWGSSGLELCDLNRDGRPDLIYTNGDGFDGQVSLPPWHGLQWLENRPDHGFIYHRIGDYPGCYSPVCVDLDGDGNMDIVAVSAFNNWRDASAVSLMAWMNDGAQHFTPLPLARTPTHLLAMAIGDLDGDGKPEIVTGGFHIYPPWTEMSRISLWKRQ